MHLAPAAMYVQWEFPCNLIAPASAGVREAVFALLADWKNHKEKFSLFEPQLSDY